MKRWLIGFVIILSLSALPAAALERPVRVMGLSGPTGLAMVKLMDEAQNSGNPYQFQIFNSPDLVVGKLVSGEADLAALPSNTAAILYNKGVAIKMTAVIGWGVQYLVSREAGLNRWTDLKGKDVYVAPKGAVPDLLFQYLLRRNGLDPGRDINIIYVASPVELAQLVGAGKVTQAVLPEPWVAQTLEKTAGLQVALDFQREWGRVEGTGPAYPQTCIVVRSTFAAEYPEAVAAFGRDLQASMAWLTRNVIPGSRMAEKYVQVPARAVQNGLERCNLAYQEAGAAREQVAAFLGRLYEVAPQAVGGRLPDEGFYYSSR